MFYHKTSTNYQKWEYFVSDSESEEEKEPILPENDPQFKAMEADMKDRAKRRKRDQKEAEQLKTMGNEALKKQCYKTAIKYYSDALDKK